MSHAASESTPRPEPRTHAAPVGADGSWPCRLVPVFDRWFGIAVCDGMGNGGVPVVAVDLTSGQARTNRPRVTHMPPLNGRNREMRTITVTNPKTGDTETIEHPDGFAAVVICDDGYYLDGVIKYATGTIVATVKREVKS